MPSTRRTSSHLLRGVLTATVLTGAVVGTAPGATASLRTPDGSAAGSGRSVAFTTRTDHTWHSLRRLRHLRLDGKPAPAATTPSGAAMPVGDLPGWKQTFAEDFTTDAPLGSFPGTAYGARWGAYDEGWKDTTKQGTYSPGRVLSVKGGALDYFVHSENGTPLVAAATPRIGGSGAGQTYGRYSVRYKVDAVSGYKTAWLLWPDSESWPSGGEIDFPEGRLDGSIGAYAHYADPNGGQDAFEPGTRMAGAWHTATVEWSPGQVRFELDGAVIGTSTKEVPWAAMHWVLQTETATGGTAPTATDQGHVLVDWATAYSKV